MNGRRNRLLTIFGTVALCLLAGSAFAGRRHVSLDMFAVGADGPLNGEYSCRFCLSQSSTDAQSCVQEVERTCTFTEGVVQERLDLSEFEGDDDLPPYVHIDVGGDPLDPVGL